MTMVETNPGEKTPDNSQNRTGTLGFREQFGAHLHLGQAERPAYGV